MADMDEFAQTRGADDLFDDEIIPVSAEQQEAQTEVLVVQDPEPESTQVQEKAQGKKQPHPRGETPQRGRGRGNRGKGGRGLQESRWADPKTSELAIRTKTPTTTAKSKQKPEPSPEAAAETPEKPEETKKAQAPQDEEKTEATPEAQRVPAVRGDRSATGGIRKPKLSEEELSKRIAAAKENAAKKAAAHARAEADQASFLEREQVAAKKRREELANRKVMDNEREQNRQRKLKAQTGREWDSEKREEDYNPRGGGSQFRRGMHGGVSGYARRDFEENRPDEPTGQESSGRRGRGGGRRGRGPGRKSRDEQPSHGSTQRAGSQTPAVNNEAEFPSLPGGKAPDTDSSTKAVESDKPTTVIKPPLTMESLDATLSPVTGTWADQVEE
ncbi:hypothetical protein N7540_003547 [Penicillium herquei]|nr:hypothetical protein N7540_003547 [Penicillium herquei]